MKNFRFKSGTIYHSNFLDCYQSWKSPNIIISDGPYGVGGYSTDLKSVKGLAEWYEPFLKVWHEKALPNATLWFWNTEQGWATVHNKIVESGWDFVNCHTWNKGLSHIAGNVNSKTIRHFPKVTEVCVQYSKRNLFNGSGPSKLTMQEWLRYEWLRTGLPLSQTNVACNVKNAATRKYFTKCHLWYFPPPESFQKLVHYANKYGLPEGKPYFSVDGRTPLTSEQWENYRYKFNYIHGFTNVWSIKQLNGNERLRDGAKSLHYNQKPLELMNLIISSTSEFGDVVWEPFGGLCSGSVAAGKLGRKFFASEIDNKVFEAACNRMITEKIDSRLKAKVHELVA